MTEEEQELIEAYRNGVPVKLEVDRDGHNHITRDIKRKGLCPVCDRDHAAYQFPAADSEGNYHT